jgi:outer membrane protein TolC
MPHAHATTLRRCARWLSAGAFAFLAGHGFHGLKADEKPTSATPYVVPEPLGRLELPVHPPRRVKVSTVKVVDEKTPERKPFVKWTPKGEPIGLAASLAIGFENAPTIKAAQASLASSTAGYLALQNFHRGLDLLRPDLPIRRQQAQRGISVGTADVLKAQQENVYDISRLYYTYVYATQQEYTATEIVEQMENFYEIANEILRSGAAGPNAKINQFTLYALEDAIGEIRRLRERATLGRKQALFAWKEAMGVGPEREIYPADKELPLMGGHVTQEQVVEFALSRRAELVQAAAAVDVSRLEICAQDRVRNGTSLNTFAAGSDLHSRNMPAPVRNGEYRPGAVAPEMPTTLVGKRSDRVARAYELAKHQEAVYEKAVGLIRLEAINAFLYWQSAVERVKEAKVRFDRGQKILEESRKAAAAKPDPELLVRNEALAGKAQAEYVEAVQKQIEALIALEKVTGGAVVPTFPGR